MSVIMLPFIYAVSLGYRFEIETGFIMFCFTFVLTCSTGKVADLSRRESPHAILSVDSPALPLTLFWC